MDDTKMHSLLDFTPTCWCKFDLSLIIPSTPYKRLLCKYPNLTSILSHYTCLFVGLIICFYSFVEFLLIQGFTAYPLLVCDLPCRPGWHQTGGSPPASSPRYSAYRCVAPCLAHPDSFNLALFAKQIPLFPKPTGLTY